MKTAREFVKVPERTLLRLMLSVNTIGNLFAETLTEILVFTPMTQVGGVLTYRIIRGPAGAGLAAV